MDRMEKFKDFCVKYGNQGYMVNNLEPILKNLEKAEQDGRLREFILNEKPYQSAFPYLTTSGGRGKDQVAIVLCLNIYGADHPGFAARLNHTLKQLSKGSARQAQNVTVLMAAQMELQKLEISLIHFVDRELIELVNRKTRKSKTGKIILWSLLSVGSAVGMPGFTMLGLWPLTFGSVALFVYSLFFRLIFWLAIPVFKEPVIEASVRPVTEFAEFSPDNGNRAKPVLVPVRPVEEQAEMPKKGPVCKACGAQMKPGRKFCIMCGRKLNGN